VKSVDIQVGRLLEIRVVAPVSMEDIHASEQRLGHFFRLRSDKLIVVADYRRATVLAPEAASRQLEIFRSFNPRVERSGILVSRNAIFSMQIERLVTNAKNPSRRAFHDPFELKAFIGSALNHEEHVRLAQFLAEDAPEGQR